MKLKPLLSLAILASSCSQADMRTASTMQTSVAQTSTVQTIGTQTPSVPSTLVSSTLSSDTEAVISAQQFSSDCTLGNENFKPFKPLVDNDTQWSISELISVQSVIHTDLNQDGIDESIVLFKPTDALQEHCNSPILDDVMVMIHSPNANRSVYKMLNIGYASLPKLVNDSRGFYLNYEVGQSIKCDNRIEFTFRDNDLYLNKLKNICYVPASDIGWQEQSFENALVSPEDINIPQALSALQSAYF